MLIHRFGQRPRESHELLCSYFQHKVLSRCFSSPILGRSKQSFASPICICYLEVPLITAFNTSVRRTFLRRLSHGKQRTKVALKETSNSHSPVLFTRNEQCGTVSAAVMFCHKSTCWDLIADRRSTNYMDGSDTVQGQRGCIGALCRR